MPNHRTNVNRRAKGSKSSREIGKKIGKQTCKLTEAELLEIEENEYIRRLIKNAENQSFPVYEIEDASCFNVVYNMLQNNYARIERIPDSLGVKNPFYVDYQTQLKLLKKIACENCENGFRCKSCGEFCPDSSSFERHVFIHSNSKKFYCSRCLRRYDDVIQLRQHVKKHTDKFPYQCTYCPKRFRTLEILSQHNEMMAKQEPQTHSLQNACLNCAACNFVTNDPLAFQDHFSRAHPPSWYEEIRANFLKSL
ncbi:hypothetical protein Aperf_G00000057071 [Anoplocephala perfoliata]